MIRHNAPTRKPKDWVPPVPAFSANVEEPVTIAYVGIQCREAGLDDVLQEFRLWCSELSTGKAAPHSVDCAEYTDAQGHYTWVSIFYWPGQHEQYDQWRNRDKYREFWESDERLEGPVGYFSEVLHIPNERLETLYSSDNYETGVGSSSGKHEGPIQSHNYWGSMRDRIPASSSENLEPPNLLSFASVQPQDSLGKRVKIDPPMNLCTIRSGEDFSELVGREKEVFEEEIAPLLAEGMVYLRDNPLETGCFSCRHMRETTPQGQPIERGFATAHFDSVTRLEDWAETHPTHLKIFGRFIELATELRGDVKLKLWHEVTVTPGEGLEFEYVNCSPETGLLPYRAPVPALL